MLRVRYLYGAHSSTALHGAHLKEHLKSRKTYLHTWEEKKVIFKEGRVVFWPTWSRSIFQNLRQKRNMNQMKEVRPKESKDWKNQKRSR